jgi:hypothetical protein
MKTSIQSLLSRGAWLGLAGAALLGGSAFGQTIGTVLSSGLIEPYAIAVDAENYWFFRDWRGIFHWQIRRSAPADPHPLLLGV